MNDEVLASGKHLRLIKRDGWEVAQRVSSNGVVCILALTNKDEIVLVEQFRKPIQKRVLELPAGLIDDGETSIDAAHRELLEETGYASKTAYLLCKAPSSAGMSDEIVDMVKIMGCIKMGAGGGIDGEDIKVHVVPIKDVIDFIISNIDPDECYVDYKVYAAIGILNNE